MKATRLLRLKYEYDDSATVEMVIWRVPQRIAGSRHSFKYRFYYGKGGERIVGYDNERGKAIIATGKGAKHPIASGRSIA